ncbi:MAG: hypothetical protein STHCBS139747_001768 [Sporothrix thermara]
MRATATAGCEACSMILDCISHWDLGNKYSDVLRLGDGLVVYSANISVGVFIHTLLGDSQATPESLTPWTVFRAASLPLEHPTLADYVALIQDMLRRCTADHEPCRQAMTATGATSFLPTRLLDIAGDRVRLVETVVTGAGQQQQPYIALSHCWGHDPVPTKTLRANKSLRLQDISWDELTQTFRDVVVLSRQLGVFYVWIDSLCIVQDDIQDWAHEAAQMASVYQHAYLTVAATSAANGGAGLFSGQRLPIYSYRGTTARTKQPFTVYARPVLDHTPFRRPHIGKGRDGRLPLLTRGWCFQEQLLCPRVVHFTAEELVWDCFAGLYCECAQNDGYDMKKRLGLSILETCSEQSDEDQHRERKRVDQKAKRLHDQLAKAWSDSVEQYTYRLLTFDKDRLPALSGLAAFYARLATGSFNFDAIGGHVGGHIGGQDASLFQSAHSADAATTSKTTKHATSNHASSESVLGTYLAGLWEKDLPFSLLWVSKYGEGQRPQQYFSLPSPSAGSAADSPISSPPSWSWASVENRVISFQRWNPPTTPQMVASAEVLRAVVFPSTSDPRGLVAGGRLTLRGPVAKLRLRQYLVRPPGGSNNYEYLDYILTYEDEEVAAPPTAVSEVPVLSKAVQSPKTVATLQADVPLDPALRTVWFLNLVEKMPSNKDEKGVISGIFLQPTTKTALASAATAFPLPSDNTPVFERVGVGAMRDGGIFCEHSTVETVIVE